MTVWKALQNEIYSTELSGFQAKEQKGLLEEKEWTPPVRETVRN